jgi:hypothetical protein
VEQDYAERLGLKLGDTVTYDVAGESVAATITSLREVRWDSFQPNFFMVFSPGVLDDVTGTLITSVHVRPEQRPALVDLVRQFPEVTIIDIDALLSQVRDVMDKAALQAEISALERNTPLCQLHDLCLQASRLSKMPEFIGHLRQILNKAKVTRKSRMKIHPRDLPQARLTTQAHRNDAGELTFQETPYHAKSKDIVAWREKRGTDPEAQKDRWNPRPVRANAYDRAKMQPHKQRFGNA